MKKYTVGLIIFFGILLSACTTQVGTKPVEEPGGDVTITEPSTSDSITISGQGVCLPHKEQGDFHTTECAYGIQTTEGDYYAVNLNEELMMSFQTSQNYIVEGTLREDTALIYDIVGVIDVASLQ